MGEVKEINIRNGSYYFYHDIIDLENFDARLLKTDKKIIQRHWYLLHWVYQKEKIDECNNIHSVNPLYLRVDHASGYIEEKNGNKYLVFDSTDENKELIEKYNDFGIELTIKSKR